MGVPSGREQYIHRLGRTGRKGKEGVGILMLAPWEDIFLKSIKDLPITKATPPTVDPDMKKKVRYSTHSLLPCTILIEFVCSFEFTFVFLVVTGHRWSVGYQM